MLSVYHVGSNQGWSEIFYFSAMKNGTDWLPRLAIYGDLGNENAQSLTRLQREAHLGEYDAIIHVGDFAYDMNSVCHINFIKFLLLLRNFANF